MKVDKTNFCPPYFFNPKPITFIEKILLIFRKKKISIDKNECWTAKTYYKQLKDKIYIISSEIERKW